MGSKQMQLKDYRLEVSLCRAMMTRSPLCGFCTTARKLLRNSTLRIYKGFPHATPTTEDDTIKADLLTFLKGASTTAAA